MLLEKGADPNIKYGPTQQTPLLNVVENAYSSFNKPEQYQQDLQNINLLLDYGADIHTVDKGGMNLSPLEFARNIQDYNIPEFSEVYKLLKQYDKKH
jgi:hypothetical protein